MRILILTVPRNYHAPILLREIFETLPLDDFLVLSSSKASSQPLSAIVKRYGYSYPYHKLVEYLIYYYRVLKERMFRTKLSKRQYVTLDEVLRSYRIPKLAVLSVNNESKPIEAFHPDMIVSLYFDQIVGNKILRACNGCSINLHPSLLPSYAGSRPTFWVLANGEGTTGISIHKLANAVDKGDIVYQTKVEITESDTQFSLYRRCTMGYLHPLIDCIEACRKGAALQSIPAQPGVQPSYYYDVHKDDVRAFLRRGRKFI